MTDKGESLEIVCLIDHTLSSAEAFCEKFEMRKSSRQRKTGKGGQWRRDTHVYFCLDSSIS